jgi:hypothetical protein
MRQTDRQESYFRVNSLVQDVNRGKGWEKSLESVINTWMRSYLTMNARHTMYADPWVTLGSDQHIPVNKAVGKKA